MTETIKTAADIVREANELARTFYAAYGYEVNEGYRFDKADRVQEQGMWTLAALAYEHIAGIDIEEALSEADNDEEETSIEI